MYCIDSMGDYSGTPTDCSGEGVEFQKRESCDLLGIPMDPLQCPSENHQIMSFHFSSMP